MDNWYVYYPLAILWMGSWQLEEQEMLTIQSTGKVLKNLFVPLKEARKSQKNCQTVWKIETSLHFISFKSSSKRYNSTFLHLTTYMHRIQTWNICIHTYYIHTDICTYPCMIMICRYKLHRERERERDRDTGDKKVVFLMFPLQVPCYVRPGTIIPTSPVAGFAQFWWALFLNLWIGDFTSKTGWFRLKHRDLKWGSLIRQKRWFNQWNKQMVDYPEYMAMLNGKLIYKWLYNIYIYILSIFINSDLLQTKLRGTKSHMPVG